MGRIVAGAFVAVLFYLFSSYALAPQGSASGGTNSGWLLAIGLFTSPVVGLAYVCAFISAKGILRKDSPQRSILRVLLGVILAPIWMLFFMAPGAMSEFGRGGSGLFIAVSPFVAPLIVGAVIGGLIAQFESASSEASNAQSSI